MIRHFFVFFLVVAGALADFDYAHAAASADEVLCDGVIAPPPVKVGDRVYREAIDLGSDELKVINAQSNVAGCWDFASRHLVAYMREHPEDYTASFVQARFIWRGGDPDAAEELLKTLLKDHPDFAGAYVLLGSLALDSGLNGTAADHFKKALELQPDDLWANVGQMRLIAHDHPDDLANAQSLAQFGLTKTMPPFARGAASHAAAVLRVLPLDQREALIRAEFDYPSAYNDAWKTLNLAEFLIEEGGKLAEGQRYLAAVPPSRRSVLILAESFLLQAAKLDSKPSEKNATEIGQAKRVLGGELGWLSPRVFEKSEVLYALRPFLFEGDYKIDPNLHGNDEYPAICLAFNQHDTKGILQLLSAGVDGKTKCGGSELTFAVINDANISYEDRSQILVKVLEQGGDPNPPAVINGKTVGLIEQCQHRNCKVFVPILERFHAQAQKH